MAPPCPRVRAWIWNIVQVRPPSALSERDLRFWFMSREGFDVRSGFCPTREREKERLILFLSQISPHSALLTSQHADSHLELLLVTPWQIYAWCALCALRVFVWSGGKRVQSQNWHQVLNRAWKWKRKAVERTWMVLSEQKTAKDFLNSQLWNWQV